MNGHQSYPMPAFGMSPVAQIADNLCSAEVGRGGPKRDTVPPPDEPAGQFLCEDGRRELQCASMSRLCAIEASMRGEINA